MSETPPPGVIIRHYCQGIGDCHLLCLSRAEGGEFFVLIDCGVHSSVRGGNEKIREIVRDVAERTKNRIDLLVLTHEHWDHISGFLTAAEEFGDIHVGDVWLAWTENPRDRQAQEIDKYKMDALRALQAASSRVAAMGHGPQFAAISQGLNSVLGFYFGAKGEKVRSARDAAVDMARGKVVYHEPGAGPLSLPGVQGLRVYVLGPPRDATLLGMTERAGTTYGPGVVGVTPMARALASACAISGLGGVGASGYGDLDAPFDPELGFDLAEVLPLSDASEKNNEKPIVTFLREHYLAPSGDPRRPIRRPREPDANLTSQSWRRIDADFLGVSADLAMQLDNRTNNTSLVLAFEFVDTRRVMLFTADAQVGNWLSWQDLAWTVNNAKVTGPDLLARTVYLKVGHHGSHNGTLRAKGLELMTSDDLVAFIPTNANDAKRVGWGKMPLPALLTVLEETTGGRVIRADDDWVVRGAGAPAELKRETAAIRVTNDRKAGLYVDVSVS
jgi:Metallo-beta-lactamase superfamily